MSDRFAYYDRDADIVWLPTGESSGVVSEEVEWGLIDHDLTTNEVASIEVWSASRRLPPEVLATLPAPTGPVSPPPDGETQRLGLPGPPALAVSVAQALLRPMRGQIVDARIACPAVLHVEIEDPAGERWHLATQDAEWSPSDPAVLVGRAIDDAGIDAATGELRCQLSDRSMLEVRSTARQTEGEPPNWELIAPGGVILEFGPGPCWRIAIDDTRPAPRSGSG
jgi:uncharacterized protein YuzE